MTSKLSTASPASASSVVRPRTSPNSRSSQYAALVRGIAKGLLPLLSLLLAAGMTAALTILAWQLTPGLDFFQRRSISMSIAATGLVATVVLYAVMCIRAIRRVAKWQQEGEIASAVGALIALSLTVIVVILPLILAVQMPQHPA